MSSVALEAAGGKGSPSAGGRSSDGGRVSLLNSPPMLLCRSVSESSFGVMINEMTFSLRFDVALS